MLCAVQFAAAAAAPLCDFSGCFVVVWVEQFLQQLGTHAHRLMPQHAYKRCSAESCTVRCVHNCDAHLSSTVQPSQFSVGLVAMLAVSVMQE